MKKSILLAVTVLALSACSNVRQAPEEDFTIFQKMVAMALDHPDDRILEITDSLVTTGTLSEPEADFVRGVVYDSQRHARLGERYYTKSYESLDPERDGWLVFLTVACQLSQLRMSIGDMNGSLDVATNALAKAEEAGQLTHESKMSLLWSITMCQLELKLPEGEETSRQVCELLQQDIDEYGTGAVIHLAIFTTGLLNFAVTNHNWAKADSLLNRVQDMLAVCNLPSQKSVVEEYLLQLEKCKIEILDGQGKEEEATSLFDATLPKLLSWPEGLEWAANYLMDKEQYTKAAMLFDRVDQLLPEDNRQTITNLDNIGFYIIPRLMANVYAGRRNKVDAIIKDLYRNYSTALSNDRKDNAVELAILYDTQGKQMQIAQQKAKLSKQRMIGTGIALILISAFFLIYSWYRRRAQKRLSIAHEKLKNAYDQLEETTAAKERIESELRIARDIQMSMVPGVFPQHKGLDMYAEMNPAKEVGGDLYGYVLQGEKLYFCLGDVSGKGVPASLFMAQSLRLFRTLATEGMAPDAIALRMNHELSENNDKGMFVTLFIGLLHLDTGRLDYCNCGHNAPVLDGKFLELQYANAPIGLWEDDPFYMETIDDIRGRQLLIYTDGLNEAENASQQLFGNDRLLQLMAGVKELSSREVIDTIKKAVEEHRDGAEPNDDLTLMCIRLSK